MLLGIVPLTSYYVGSSIVVLLRMYDVDVFPGRDDPHCCTVRRSAKNLCSLQQE